MVQKTFAEEARSDRYTDYKERMDMFSTGIASRLIKNDRSGVSHDEDHSFNPRFAQHTLERTRSISVLLKDISSNIDNILDDAPSSEEKVKRVTEITNFNTLALSRFAKILTGGHESSADLDAYVQTKNYEQQSLSVTAKETRSFRQEQEHDYDKATLKGYKELESISSDLSAAISAQLSPEENQKLKALVNKGEEDFGNHMTPV